MNKFILILFLFLSTQLYAIEQFTADYTVYKDGKKIGLSTMQLSKTDDIYTISDNTKGTHGMASFLGFTRSETTHFTSLEHDENKDAAFIPSSYQMNQKVAFNKRQSEYHLGSKGKFVEGIHKDKSWKIAKPELFTTPNLVSLNLFRDICAGKTMDLNYQTLKAGELKTLQFIITSTNDNIVEVDKVHSKPTRITKTWLDTAQNCIPIKTYHIEPGEDALETRLIEYVAKPKLEANQIN